MNTEYCNNNEKNNIRIFNATFFIAIIIKLKKNSAETKIFLFY